MANYINKLGDVYTQEEIEAAALENGVDVDTVIADNELTQEEPGKTESVVAQKPSTTQKEKPKKSASSTKTTSSASAGKKTYPWGDQTKKNNGDFLKGFKEDVKVKKQNIKKSNDQVFNFVNNQDPLQKILNPAESFNKTLEEVATAPQKTENQKLEAEERKVLSFADSKIDYQLISDKLNSEINNSEFIDGLREGAKGFFNEMVLGPISMVGQAMGADVDLTISPYKPLEAEKKQAVYELSKTRKKDQKITENEINDRAKEIFYEKEIIKQKGKAVEEYFDSMYDPESVKLQEKLKIKAIGDKLKTSDEVKQRTILAKTLNSQLGNFDAYAKDFKTKYNAGKVTDAEIDEYNTKSKEATAAYSQLEYIYKDFPTLLNKLESDTEKLDYFKYNYNDVENSLKNLYGTSLGIVGGTLKIVGDTSKYIDQKVFGLEGDSVLSTIGSEMITDANLTTANIKRTTFDDIDTFSDFGKYAGNLLTEQIPVYASMYFGGNWGAAGVSLGAGGQKIQEMEAEEGMNYDLGTKLLAGYGFAASEFIPEKLGTLRMFENMKDAMSTVGTDARQLFKEGFAKSSLDYVARAGFESLVEGSTEATTELLNIVIDEQLLNKKVSSTEKVKRIKEAFAGGSILGGGMQSIGGASVLVSKELKNYATNQELAASKTIMDRISFLQEEAQNNTKLSTKEEGELKAEIARLTDDALSIIDNSKDRVYDMSNEDMVAVLNINKEQKELKDSYLDLLNSNFSPEIKKEKIDNLKDRFKELESNREFLLTGQYAMANKIVGNRVVINSSVENIKKIANTLGKKDIANKIGDQNGIAVFSEVKDLKDAYTKWLTNENKANIEYNLQNREAKQKDVLSPEQIENKVEEASKSDGFYLPNDQIVINLAVASRTGAINVAQHEFLHKVLRSAFENTTELNKTVNDFLSVLTPKEKVVVQKRIDDNYRYAKDENGEFLLDKSGNKIENKFEEYSEEYFTAFIDAIAMGDIGGKNQVKDILRRAAKPFLKLLQKLGWSNAKFSDGREFYDFLKDYQSNVSKGRINKRAQALLKGESLPRTIRYSKSIEERMDDLEDQLTSGEIDIDLYESRMKALEKEEADLKRKEYEEKKSEVKKPEAKPEAKPTDKKPTKAKEDAEVSEIANKAKAKLDAIGNDPKGFNPNNPVIYTELDKMVKAKSRNWKTAKGTIIDLTNKDKGGIDGFDLEQMTSYVTASMIPYIAKFDPSRNNSLYGYINAQYINRMKGALKSGEVADVVFAEDVSEMTKLSSEEVEVKKPSLPERKRFQNILESGVFSPEVIEEIQRKALTTVRTLKSKINEKTTLNKTVAPIIEEIRLAMGAQADIDIKKAMGGKEGGQLVKWLIANKKTVLENATTTWLMGKDNGKTVLGGMPFAIQKRVDGRWLNYPDWVGKKVDRESVDVDLAGRTAGHEMVRRLPDVDKNVPNDVFIESIVDPATKIAIRGRKESLAKMMAEEISFDIISDDFANDGLISQAFKKNQEMLGVAIESVIEQEFNRLAERGNVKYSNTKELFKALKDNNFSIPITVRKNTKFAKWWAIQDDDFKKRFEINVKKYIRIKEENDKKAKESAAHRIKEAIARTQLDVAFKKLNIPFYVSNKSGRGKIIDLLIRRRGNTAINIYGEVKLDPNAIITSFNFSKKWYELLPDIVKDINSNIKSNDNNLYNLYKDIINFDVLTDPEKENSIKLNSKELRDYSEAKEKIRSGEEVGNMAGKDTSTLSVVGADLDVLRTIESKKDFPVDFIIINNQAFVLDKDNEFSNSIKSISEVLEGIENPIEIKTRIKLDEGRISLVNNIDFSKEARKKIEEATKDADIKASVYLLTNLIQSKFSEKAISANNKSLENNLNSFKQSKSIDLVSKYISDNNIKRISAEDSFDVLNSLVKEVENYWGVVPDNIITLMDRSIDYAFDVIEDRENEGGPLMAAVNDALNLETIKNTEVQLNKFIDNNKIQTPKFSKSLDYEFNDMLERNKGIPSYEKVSDIVAKRTGKKVTRLSFFVPPSADDFRGLTTYMFAGSGKQGELDQEFFDKNLVIPYVKGVNALDSVRQSIKKEYKKLLDSFPNIKSKLEKPTPDKKFTYDQAIRVYLWNKNDIDIPGLNRVDKNKLIFLVKNDSDLMAFANALSLAGRQDGGWMKPSVTWDSDTIISDLHNITEGEGRKKWLSEFIENADAIFTPENLNKVQSIYGTDVRNQIEDSLYRMKNGKSRPEGTDAITNKWMNWINGSTSAIMFFNTRSALLQTISSTNYLNWNDNNPIAAAAAFANQKQYWADFATIINSDKMRERRSGLKADVTQAEIANAANSATDKAKGILSYLQKIGFTPTQAADSFSIAIGGAAFYRNRVNTYLKQVDEDGNKINTLEEAEGKAWLDFSIITDKSMQSADPMYVSKQQTTALGRLVLAFANTPMQYNREIKKATLDLVNKRRDWKTNVSKIVYYGALQNLLFSALQAALFLPFDDEDEDAIAKMSKDEKKAYDKLVKKQEDKTKNILNGMLDTVLRGSGVYGALVSTIKNVAMEYQKQEERENFADHAQTLLALSSISPPISSKARKLYGIHRTNKFEKDVIEKRGWEVTSNGRLNLSPKYTMVGNAVMATTNIPLDRLVEKVENISEVLDNRNTVVQRTALFLGWKEWELNVKNEENEKIKTEAKEKRKEEGIEKAIETRRAKKEAEKEAYKQMSTEEKFQYNRKKAKEKIEKRIERRKKKIEEIKAEVAKRKSKRKMG